MIPAQPPVSVRRLDLAAADYGFDVSTMPTARIVSCEDAESFLAGALPTHSAIGVVRRSSFEPAKLIEALSGAGSRRVVDLGGISPHTPIEDVRSATARADGGGLDFIVGIGGGSTI